MPDESSEAPTTDKVPADGFTADDAVALYDEIYRWDGATVPADRFFDELP